MGEGFYLYSHEGNGREISKGGNGQKKKRIQKIKKNQPTVTKLKMDNRVSFHMMI